MLLYHVFARWLIFSLCYFSFIKSYLNCTSSKKIKIFHFNKMLKITKKLNKKKYFENNQINVIIAINIIISTDLYTFFGYWYYYEPRKKNVTFQRITHTNASIVLISISLDVYWIIILPSDNEKIKIFFFMLSQILIDWTSNKKSVQKKLFEPIQTH